MTRLLSLSLLPLLTLGACRPPANVPKDTPLDFAALPGPTNLGTEATLAARWAGSLKTHWDSAEKVSVTGVDGVVVRGFIHRVTNPRAAVVVLGGRTEFSEKFAEVIDDLNNAGYSTYALDHRGQGTSDRLLPNHEKGHVSYFDDYVSDLHAFITTVVQKDHPRQVFIVAHSMGGAIAILYADAHPEVLAGMAISSPMLDIKTTGFPPAIASTLGLTACDATDGTAYAITQHDYVEQTDVSKSAVTSSEARNTWKVQLLRDDTTLRIGGATWRYLCAALTASSAAQQLGRYSPVPTLVLEAGNDQVVNVAAEERYCTDAPRCQLSRFPDGQHELFQERDDIRNEAMGQVVKFLNAKVTP